MAERDYERDEGGKFAETGGGGAGNKKATAASVGKRLYGKQQKAFNEFAAAKSLGAADKKQKLKEYVAKETPKPPVDAEWQGEEKPPAEDVTWGKYMEGPEGDTSATVKDPERRALHDAIKESYIGANSLPPKGEQPLAIVMMGGSGSGKTSLLKGLKDKEGRLPSFVHIDPDGVKEKLPEFRDGVAAKVMSAAGAVHEESTYVAKQLREQALSEGRNVIYDGTGADAKKYGAFIDQLKSKGYRVEIKFSHLPLEEAEARIHDRAERSGRWVPKADYQKNHASVPKNWEQLAQKVDNAEMYTTSGTAGPKKLWSVTNGVATHHEPEAVAAFKKRYGS